MSALGLAIIEALGGPEHCRLININIPVVGPPTVTFKCLVAGERAEKALRDVISQYELKPRSQPENPSA